MFFVDFSPPGGSQIKVGGTLPGGSGVMGKQRFSLKSCGVTADFVNDSRPILTLNGIFELIQLNEFYK